MMSMKAIKRRITSVRNTQQIMKAMNLVATSKLQKAKAKMYAIHPLFIDSKRIMSGVRNSSEDVSDNPFVKPREVKNTYVVLITGDRGLCGGYNINVSKKALEKVGAGTNIRFITVGQKGWEYIIRRRKKVTKRITGISEHAFFEDAEKIGTELINLYISGEADEIYVAYTGFASMMSHIPKVEKILPLGDDVVEEDENAEESNTETHSHIRHLMAYEPDINTFLSHAVPMYISVFIYGAMVEASACEQAARMISMDSAAKNAGDIIDSLTLMFNRQRQGIITQEINEIVSGANALQ